MAFPRLNLLCSDARENTRKNSKVQNCQVLRAHSFAVHWPKLTYNTSLESPDIFLYEKFKKIGMGVFLGPFMNIKSNLISYNKTTIVPEWLSLSVWAFKAGTKIFVWDKKYFGPDNFDFVWNKNGFVRPGQK